MTETETETNPIIETPAPLPPPVVIKKPRSTLWPAVFGVLFLLLAAGEAYLWFSTRTPNPLLPNLQTQVAVLQAEVTDLRSAAAHAQPAPDSVSAQADLSMKFAALAAQVNAVQAQAAADHGSLTALQQNSADLTQLTTRISLLSALERARMALDAGQPLGAIPGAPPALANFAATPAPLQAALRLSFPAAARAAELADTSSIANDRGIGLWRRIVARLEGMITISDGTHVILGSPAAGIVEAARAALEAGDLSGAVNALDTLSPPAQRAMGDWLAQARALVAARAALISMASQD
jgi:hypothetical protein